MIETLGIIIAVLALFMSCINSYHQFFRNRVSGALSLLRSGYSDFVKDNKVEIEVDIAISNTGNKQFVISKILLLHETSERNGQRALECNLANGHKIIEMKPDSVTQKKLTFKQSKDEFFRDLNRKEQTGKSLDLLIYSINNTGQEFYNQISAANLTVNEKSIVSFNYKAKSVSLFCKKDS
ncbi:MAG: bisphosphoglycerate-dependent phosphoglycerate mutase [Desulforhopalus sp.]|jgi:bisphosphoglycerate-dependent phosphoglycerate mutase